MNAVFWPVIRVAGPAKYWGSRVSEWQEPGCG